MFQKLERAETVEPESLVPMFLQTLPYSLSQIQTEAHVDILNRNLSAVMWLLQENTLGDTPLPDLTN